MRKPLAVLSLLVILATVLTACGAKASPTPAPTQVLPPTEPPAPTPVTPATAKPTQTPEAKPAVVPVTLWHSWTGAQAEALSEVAKAFQNSNPGVQVDLLAVPIDQLKDKFIAETAKGSGPDLLIGPKEWIGDLVEASQIIPLDDLANKIGINNLNPSAADANRYQGQLWAFPVTIETIALWYNTGMVSAPPKDTGELLNLAATAGLGLNTGFYQAAGFLLGDGGKIFDANQKCILDQGASVVDGLAFLATAKNTTGVLVDSDASKLDAAFKEGKIGMIFSGPSAIDDYVKALGAGKLAIAPPITLQYGSGKFSPFLETTNVFLSANSKGGSVLDFLKYLSDPTAQAMLAKVGRIPSNLNARADDPLIAGFLKQTASASYFPNEPEMDAVLTSAGDMIAKVIDGKAKPADAVKEACAAIDASIKK